MSMDQIYNITMMILQIVLCLFVGEHFGYIRGKNSVKGDVLQKQITQSVVVIVNPDKPTPVKSFTKST